MNLPLPRGTELVKYCLDRSTKIRVLSINFLHAKSEGRMNSNGEILEDFK